MIVRRVGRTRVMSASPMIPAMSRTWVAHRSGVVLRMGLMMMTPMAVARFARIPRMMPVMSDLRVR